MVWDLMRLLAIGGGVAGGVGATMGARGATFATWVAGATGLVLGAVSLPTTNALILRVTSERGLAILHLAVFLGTIMLCVGTVLLVHRLVVAP
jgi:hypothetical protein